MNARMSEVAEDSDLLLQRLIAARTQATEKDIIAGRKAIVRAVAEKTGEQFGDLSLNCDIDEAEALVRAAVQGKSEVVGERIAKVVNDAIYAYVLPLAQADLADAEKRRDEASLSERAMRWLWNNGVLA
jgi:cation transport regulator ChaB